MSIISKTFMGEPVDISKYDPIFPDGGIRETIFKKGTFVKWYWLFIGDWKIDDPRLDNTGVKAEQNKGEDSDEMAYDYEVNGWDQGSFPPALGTDGDMRNGRTRVIAAIKKAQQWIPAALFNFEETDTPVKDKVTEGLRANVQKPMTRSVTEDFVAGGVAAIDAGELKRDADEIMDWLVNDTNIGDRFGNENGQWTRIVNMILERSVSKDNLTLVLSRDDWFSWINFIPNIDLTKVILYKAGTSSQPSRFWSDHVLPNAGKMPPVILYTDAYSPEKCSAVVEGFISELAKMYTQTYAVVNNDLAGGPLSLTTPATRPYNIIGVCPNLKRGDQPQNYKNHILMDVTQYVADGAPKEDDDYSGIEAALGIAA